MVTYNQGLLRSGVVMYNKGAVTYNQGWLHTIKGGSIQSGLVTYNNKQSYVGTLSYKEILQ